MKRKVNTPNKQHTLRGSLFFLLIMLLITSFFLSETFGALDGTKTLHDLHLSNQNSAVYRSQEEYNISVSRGPTATAGSMSIGIYLPVLRKDPTPTPTPTPIPTPLVTNADFEMGNFSGWATGGELRQSITNSDRHSGNFAALLGDPALGDGLDSKIPAGRAYIEQIISIPFAKKVEVSFWYRLISYDVMSGDDTDRVFDTFDVTINDVLLHRDGNPDPNGQASRYDSGWKQAVLDLNPYRGQSVTLRFAVWNREYPPRDGLDLYNTWVYMDDMSIRSIQPTIGDFETGNLSDWTTGGQLSPHITSKDTHSGNFAALLGNPEEGAGLPPDLVTSGTGYIERMIQVPSFGRPQLSFWYHLMSYDVMIGCNTDRVFDSLDVTINEMLIHQNGNPTCDSQGHLYDSGWKQALLDLSAYRGQAVTLRFAVWNREYDQPPDGLDAYNTWIYLDDITLRNKD